MAVNSVGSTHIPVQLTQPQPRVDTENDGDSDDAAAVAAAPVVTPPVTPVVQPASGVGAIINTKA